MKLSTRLAIAMVALVLAVSTVLSTVTYFKLTDLVIPRALDRLQTQSQLNAIGLQTLVNEGVDDVVALCESDALKELIARQMESDADPASAASAAIMRRHFESRFVGELKAIPAYQSIRIVGRADGGRDLIRVYRDKNSREIKVASGEQLRRWGDRAYFKTTLQLQASEVHVSSILSQKDEAGKDIVNGDPVIHIAKPLFTEQGDRFGIAVININLTNELERIRANMTHGNQSFLIDSSGRYLFHPNYPSLFGSGAERAPRVYDDFAEFDDALASHPNGSAIWPNNKGDPIAVGWTSVQLAHGLKIVAMEAIDYPTIDVGLQAVQISSLAGGSIAMAAAILLAVFLARSLAKPLAQMTDEVKDFSKGKKFIVQRQGGSEEISILSSAFAQMAADIGQKTELLTNTFDSIADPILVGDSDGNILLANDAAHRLLGVVPGECSIAGQKSFELFAPGEREQLPFRETAMARALSGEATDDLSLQVQTPERRFDVRVSGRPLYDDSGRIAGGVVAYRDVTENNRALAALVASEHKAQMIIETALDAFIQLDESGKVITWSPKAEQMFGWTAGQAIGRFVGEIIVPARNRSQHRERLAQFQLEAAAGASGWRYISLSLRCDGTEIITEVSLTSMRQGEGTIINAFLRDITQQREAELQLQQAQRLESIGQLTGGIAHDFNNLLTVITGTIEVLADGVQQNPALSAIVRLIDEAAARGAKLTGSLLSFARKQPLQPEVVDANALILDICNLLEPTLGRNIKITTELADQTCLVSADASQLGTALLNLAINARDAMPEGGDLAIKSMLRDFDAPPANFGLNQGTYVAVEVRDTGAGIPPGIRERIFEPFFTTKEPGKGTGLGLSMVYGFVKQSGGHVEVASSEGQGTTFTIYLPKAERHAVAEPVSSSRPDRGTETILCVEDDASVRFTAMKLLQDLGYTVLSAENAQQALAIEAEGRHFDLLFTDIMMPGRMNGFQLATEMAARRPGIKVLFTSGFEDGAIVRYGYLDKGTSLLAKPYRRAELARKLRDALATEEHDLAADLSRKAAGG